jgi:hypothetical protein
MYPAVYPAGTCPPVRPHGMLRVEVGAMRDAVTWYEIRVQGHLAPHLATWFEGLTLSATPAGETVLVGPVVDQAALHGYLLRVRDLGLPLLSVRVVEPE